MRLRQFASLAMTLTIVIFGVAGSSYVAAQDIQFATGTSPAAMPAQQAPAQMQLVGYNDKGHKGSKDPLNDFARKVKGNKGGKGDWLGGDLMVNADVLYLRPYSSLGLVTTTKYNAAPRLTASYTRPDGLGGRVRLFNYSANNLGAIQGYDIFTVDAEVTNQFQLGNWSGIVSGGTRFANAEERITALSFLGGPTVGPASLSMNGWGPIVGVELYCPLRNNLSLYGTARYSMLFGRTFATGGMLVGGSAPQTSNVAELQLGVQYVRDGLGSTQFIARAGYEGQYWRSTNVGGLNDLGLSGGVFSFGFLR